jgi:hypothetical protein
VRAVVDSPGNLSRTRRHTLTRFAMLGPFAAFAPKATKHDDRELFLLVEAPDWAEMVQCPADAQAKVRALAQKINLAARNVNATRATRRIRVAEAGSALQAVRADRAGIIAATERLRAEHGSQAAIAAEMRALDQALGTVSELDARYVRSARSTYAKVSEEISTAPMDPGASRPSALPWNKAAPAQPLSEESSVEAQHDFQIGADAMANDAPSGGDEGLLGEAVAEERPASGPNVGASPGEPDVLRKLRDLGELRSAGVLTNAEFDDAKRQLLARI